MSNYCTALITGGTSGIGLETASLFLEKGYKVFITGLDRDELTEALEKLSAVTAHSSVDGIALDLTLPGAVRSLYQSANEYLGRIDVLINNAGFGVYGSLASTDVTIEQSMLRLNILALHELSCLALRDMVDHDRGHIINISSISAFQPAPYLASYGASKAFVLQFTLSMHYELKDRGSGVRATAICPTPVRTNFEKKAKLESTNLFNSWMVVDVKLVAATVFKALNSSRACIVPGRFFDIANKISKRLPVSLLVMIAKRQLRRKVR